MICRRIAGGRRAAFAALATFGLLLLAGCHHHTTTAYAPPPPAVSHGYDRSPVTGNVTPLSPEGGSGFFDATDGRPVFTETGMATWYYAHGHMGSDGLRYEGTAPTAAHKTLPLGSTVRVTNLDTGKSTLVRITDRGPFAKGRVMDLSEMAAKELGMYQAGVAHVRLEAFAHPGADPLGRWCVQTGPFTTARDALDLKAALVERYRGARVAEFTGQTGYWVRIDPVTRGRSEAGTIAGWIGSPDAQTTSYVVRIN